MFIIKRYLPAVILVAIMALIVWFTLIIFSDGLLPVIGFFLMISAVILTVPVMAYLDYCHLKAQILETRNALKKDGDLSSTQAIGKLAETVGVKMGVPAFMVSAAVRAVEKQVRSRIS